MAKQRCINLLKKGAAHLTTKEAKELVDELESRASAKAAKEGIGLDEAMKRTGQQILDEEAQAVRLKKKQAIQNIRINREIDDFISKFDSPLQGWKAYLGGVETNVAKSRMSVDAVQKQQSEKFVGKFIFQLEDQELMNTWHDPNNELMLSRELFSPGSTGNVNAQKIGKIINESYDDIRRIANLHGAEIGDIESYVARQTHDQELLAQTDSSVFKRQQLRREIINKHKLENPGNTRKAYLAAQKEINTIAYERWKNFILPRLDPIKTEGLAIDNPDEYLRKVYDAITTGVHFKDSAEAFAGKFEIRKAGNLSDRLSASRKLFFKDGDSWSQYNSKYGHGNIQTAVTQTLDSAGANIGLMKRMGPNPKNMFKKKQEDIQIQATQKGFTPNKIANSLKRARHIFSEIDRERNEPVANLTAKIGGSIRQGTIMTKLGSVMLSAFPDLASRGAAMRQNGRGFLTGIKEGLDAAFTFKKDSDKIKAAALMGTWAKFSVGYSRSRFAAVDSRAGVFSRMTQLFMKANGMQWVG